MHYVTDNVCFASPEWSDLQVPPLFLFPLVWRYSSWSQMLCNSGPSNVLNLNMQFIWDWIRKKCPDFNAPMSRFAQHTKTVTIAHSVVLPDGMSCSFSILIRSTSHSWFRFLRHKSDMWTKQKAHWLLSCKPWSNRWHKTTKLPSITSN